MNNTIWKFQLPVTDSFNITMPKGAEILTAQTQDRVVYIWALVNPDAPLDSRTIEIHGTGNPIHVAIGVKRKYIATVQQGPFVWHVFERLNQ